MAKFEETHTGEQYVKGEWLVEVVDIKPPEIVTKVLKPAYKAGKVKKFVATEWLNYDLFSREKTEKVDDTKNGAAQSNKLFSVVIDENGKLVVKDKDNLVVLNLDDVHGPKGDDGYVDPVIKDGKLYFRNKNGDIINSGGVVKGEDGVSYEPVWDEKAGQLRFKNSKTGELRPGGFDIKGKDGEKGADGKSFTPKVTPDGEYLYFVDGDGKEIPGQYLIKGKDGDHGREFIPHTTEDGFLYFTNRKGDEIPGTRVKVRGADGKRGIALVPQIDSDGNLHWIKKDSEELTDVPPVNIKGDSVEGPEGATFTPYVKDGVLYWTNNKNLPNPDSARISGPKGDTGDQGVRGLSAYEIWRKQGYWGTEQDFLDSLKGEKGTPAPPASFSFKDVEDFKCKVQQIDTKLIVDSDQPIQSPKEIIEERTNEIIELRELGRQKRNESWFRKWPIWNVILLGISVVVLIGTIVASSINPTTSNSSQAPAKSVVVDTTQVISDTISSGATDKTNGGGVSWGGLIVCSVIIVLFLLCLLYYNKKSNKEGGAYQDEKDKDATVSEEHGTSKANNQGERDKNATKGEKHGTPKAHKIGLLKEFTWWCAGADKDLLAMCPGDHSKYVGIGTTILFTALMAWFSSFIAMQLVFPEATIPIGSLKINWAAALFATFWMALIFCLDRFITNTMYSDGKVTISKQEFIGGLPRIVIAIILGIIISAPLELIIFEDQINFRISEQKTEIAEDRVNNKYDQKNQDNNESIKAKKREITNKEKEIEDNKKPDQQYTTVTTYKDIYDENGKYIGRKEAGTTQVETEAYKAWRKENDKLKKELDDLKRELENLENGKKTIQDDMNSDLSDEKVSIDTSIDTGLLRRLAVLHELGMEGYDGKEWFKSWGTFGEVLDALFHRWWWFLFNSAIGLIMLLFILIDISPVLYKMMLADGKYDNYLHQEKLLAQDKIRLSLANMLKGLDDSELKRVAPFVMGDIYSKMAGDSFVYKSEADFKREMRKNGRKQKVDIKSYEKELRKEGRRTEDQINSRIKIIKKYNRKAWWYNALYIDMWRLWPASWLKAIFWKSEEKPSAPVIVFTKKDEKDKSPFEKTQENIDVKLNEANDKIFDEVLDMKKRIILASYRRWYKTQHDCIICDDINDENKGKEPFEEDSYPPRDPDNKQKGKDPDDKKKEDVKDDTKHDDKSNDESTNDNDPFGDDDNSFDEKVNEDLGTEDTQETNSNEESTNETEINDNKESEGADEEDDDEHELPDDDGDDRPKN